jgi:ATP-dependent exoDNAse (exonuclease V) beta subunit
LKNNTPFLIYNASAGSGKTYSLVKAYLKTLFSNPRPDYYKYLLAITFTNKAVAEMKQRIIEYLKRFSEADSEENAPEMMHTLAAESELSIQQIHTRSKSILHHLLHHYSAFSVETIDGFNHRLIRTFAHDLKIASNFEVSLDQDELLEQAVDNLLRRTGDDPEITKTLVRFTLAKTDEDRSWDISRDIMQASGILFNENELDHVQRLKEKSLAEFGKIAARLQSKLENISKELKTIAKNTLQLIDESGLQHKDFSGRYYPKFMLKVVENKELKFDAKWQESIRDKPLYPKRLLKESAQSASVMDELAPSLATAFDETKQLYFRKKFIKSLLNNLTPLSVINLVQHELDLIKEEDNLLPISEFNQLINTEIKNQPAPFIYERLGERYRHFFIDEFQDTSQLQWENLIPLIDNSLAQEQDSIPGSLLLVGDAKQSIYRWRGGLPEQFIDLYNCKNPFSISEKIVLNLDVNWRSCATIIDFNNTFFAYLAHFFTKTEHTQLYTLGNQQKHNDKPGGYVRLEFVEYDKKEEADQIYADRISTTVKDLLDRGYNLKDICILNRRKKEGIALGAILTELGLAVVSSESLLLQHSKTVQFLADFLQFRTQPENDEIKSKMLCFLHKHFEISESLADFLSRFFPSKEADFFEELSGYGIHINIENTQSITLYECCEYLLKVCHILPSADAYVDGFMNVVFEFEQRQVGSKQNFTDFWNIKKEKSAITIGDGIDAIRMMTIHKAKGLEFPVVLFPYADVDIYYEKSAKCWISAEELTEDDDLYRINFNKDVADYNEEGAGIYQDRRSRLQLDNINLLYVTLTRAAEQLYIYSKKESLIKDSDLKRYGEFFRNFLIEQNLWDDTKSIYEYGSPVRSIESLDKISPKEMSLIYQTSLPEELNLQVVSREASLWQTEAEIAISAGAVMHDLMERIHRIDDIDHVIGAFQKEKVMSEQELKLLEKMIRNIVTHPDLSVYYSSDAIVENERDIITADGRVLRPDRINFHDNDQISILDYKTGGESQKHVQQIEDYADALKAMGYVVVNKLIIYASEAKIVINKL